MKKLTIALSILVLLNLLSGVNVYGQCDSTKLKAFDERTTLVIDARVNQINSFRGKTEFRRDAQLGIVNMNPFKYKYTVVVQQQAIEDTAFLDFLKLLGAPVSGLIDAQSAVRLSADETVPVGGNLSILERRTNGTPTLSGACAEKAEALKAVTELADVRRETLDIRNFLQRELAARILEYNSARRVFKANEGTLYSDDAEMRMLCDAANNMLTGLTTSRYPSGAQLEVLRKELTTFRSRAAELKSSATEVKADYADCKVRVNGMIYFDNLIRLAAELDDLGNAYEQVLTTLANETNSYDAVVAAVRGLKDKEHLMLQREVTFRREHEISAADIRVVPERLPENSTAQQRFPVVGDISTASARTPAAEVGFSRTKTFIPAGLSASAQDASDGGDGNGGGNGGTQGEPKKEIKARAIIGARRFELSAGMVFSSLERREFKPVLGFARNAEGKIVDDEGNPTDKRELSSIIGLTESTKSRFAPVAVLHTRLTENPNYNLFFSVGVTGKNDNAGFDLEYLVGPSVNFLNRKMFFTFGGYAGRQQKLAGDAFVGAKLADGEVPVRKDYVWKPGFSFTYRLPIKGPGAGQ
jgi:hypothetical protein